MYESKFEGKDEIIDLSLLPPCSSSLKLHSMRAAYIARRYRLSTENYIEEPNPSEHGWTSDGQIRWIDRAFPEEIELLLVDEDDGETTDSNYSEEEDMSEDSDEDFS